MFFNKENNNPKKQEIDQSFFDDLRKFYKTGDFKEENKEELSEYYIDNNKFQINENIKNNCFSFMDKSSFTIQYNEREYLIKHFFDKNYYKNDEIFNIQRLNYDDNILPDITLTFGDRHISFGDADTFTKKDKDIKEFFSTISIDYKGDLSYITNEKNCEKEVEKEYCHVVDIINKHFNQHFKFKEDFTFTFEKDKKEYVLKMKIDSSLESDFERCLYKGYEIDLNKKEKEIYLVTEDPDWNVSELKYEKIYSSHNENIVGTDINVCNVNLEKFPERLYECINFINNEKYNFIDFNYKSFDDFKNSVKNIEKSSEHVDKNEYEK